MRTGKSNLEDEEYEEEEFSSKKDGTASTGNTKDAKNSDKANAIRSKHSVTEQRRRSKINERFQILRDLIPHSDQKRDTASFLLEVIDYVQHLQEKVQKYEGSYQGWSSEPTKLMPWRNSHWRVQSFVGHPQTMTNGSGLGATFPGKIEENNVSLTPTTFTSTHKLIESDPSRDIACRPIDQQLELANKGLPLPMPLHANMPVSVSGDGLQPHFQGPVSDAQSTECAASSETLNPQEELIIEGGTISISSAYSQGLLNTLTQALQNAGLDLSQASVSVQIDLGKRANRGITSGMLVAKDHENPLSSHQDEEMAHLRDAGLSSHPTIGKAAAKAATEHGMGPRGSALICGYTSYHRLLESCLADLKKKEDCLLCPTGFAANMALMVALGNIGSLLAAGRTPLEEERIAIFSDALNHASIIDGIRLAERQRSTEVFIYRHCDMSHLDLLLSKCKLKKKVVVTDSLFSMDGDFAPMVELVTLRKKHRFLFVIDDAHGTFVCGENGGGVAEEFNCEGDVDICIGTLSKAAGCHGGFIACSKKWKQLIQSRGRSFIYSTTIPVPIAAAAHAAVEVAKKETWRRKAIWERVQDFRALTGIPITSPIISLIVGSEEKALQASRHMLRSGFHVTAIRPPTVPPKSCRLRVTLSAAHTLDDLKKLTMALSHCIDLRDIGIQSPNGHAKL